MEKNIRRGKKDLKVCVSNHTHTDKDSMVAYKTKYGYVKTKTICRKIIT